MIIFRYLIKQIIFLKAYNLMDEAYHKNYLALIGSFADIPCYPFDRWAVHCDHHVHILYVSRNCPAYNHPCTIHPYCIYRIFIFRNLFGSAHLIQNTSHPQSIFLLIYNNQHSYHVDPTCISHLFDNDSHPFDIFLDLQNICLLILNPNIYSVEEEIVHRSFFYPCHICLDNLSYRLYNPFCLCHLCLLGSGHTYPLYRSDPYIFFNHSICCFLAIYQHNLFFIYTYHFQNILFLDINVSHSFEIVIFDQHLCIIFFIFSSALLAIFYLYPDAGHDSCHVMNNLNISLMDFVFYTLRAIYCHHDYLSTYHIDWYDSVPNLYVLPFHTKPSIFDQSRSSCPFYNKKSGDEKKIIGWMIDEQKVTQQWQPQLLKVFHIK